MVIKKLHKSVLKIIFSKGCFILLLLFQASKTFSQHEASFVPQSFGMYGANNYQEKVFLHTDKTVYATGEILWFKAYITNAQNGFSLLSKICYVEILTNDNKPLLQGKISIDSGRGDGSFVLPASVRSGNYIIRAYTNWMKNFDPHLYFYQQISIINPNKKPEIKNTVNADSIHADFFAEGGNLVYGMQNTIAFKVAAGNGKGLLAKGFIISGKDTVTSFATEKFGMGSFSFIPEKQKIYQAVIKVNNTVLIKNLPQVYDNGYVLHVKNNAGKIDVNVSCNVTDEHSVYVLIQNDFNIKRAQMLPLVNGEALFSVDESELAEGISRITVFNEHKQPVCERLYFKRPHNILHIKTTGLQKEHTTRSKVSLRLSSSMANSYAANAKLSASIYLTDSLQPEQTSNIINYLWLGADVKGYIESPGYYFDSTNFDADKAADNLMLTQGWRRFKWINTLTDTVADFTFLPEYEGHIITGRVTAKQPGMQVAGRNVYLSVPGKVFRFSQVISQTNGNVLFNVEKFYGSRELIAQPDVADSDYRIFIDNPFSDKFIENNLSPLILHASEANTIILRSTGAQAQSVYQPSKQDNFSLPAQYDTTAFYGIPFKSYYLDNYTRFPTMEEVMKEYVKEVHVRKREKGFRYEVFNEPDISYFNKAPLTLIDGVPVFDVTKIINIDPLKIEKVDVTATRFYKGNNEYDGIVSYATYNGDLDGYQLDPGSLVVEYDGLQYKREFYEPQYETQQQQQSRLPDYRNVLYWNPQLNTTKGTKDFSFYTSDIPGTYTLLIQGINEEGKAGYYTENFVVK